MLKQRIISGILLCAVITPAVFIAYPPAFKLRWNFVRPTLEILRHQIYETKNVGHKPDIRVCHTPLSETSTGKHHPPYFAVLLFATIIFSKGTTASILAWCFRVHYIPSLLPTLLYVRSLENGQFSIFLVFIGAFGTDAGAYFLACSSPAQAGGAYAPTKRWRAR